MDKNRKPKQPVPEAREDQTAAEFGRHGERLNEVQIDNEVASRSMAGGHSVSQEDVEAAFTPGDAEKSQ